MMPSSPPDSRSSLIQKRLFSLPLPHNEAENIKEEEEKEGTLLPPVCSCVFAGAKGRVDPNYYFGFAAYVDMRDLPIQNRGLVRSIRS